MPRTLTAYLSKCADMTIGMDILARAQFWEGFCGYHPFQKIHGVSSPPALLRLIASLMEEAAPGLSTKPEMAAWLSPLDTKLYRSVLQLVSKIVYKFGIDGSDILQEEMSRDDTLGSIFYAVGKGTAKTRAAKVVSGDYLPEVAAVLARKYAVRRALDAVQKISNRGRIEQERGGDVVEQTMGPEPDENGWATIIKNLLTDPENPIAKDFFTWVRSYARDTIKSPVLVAYLDNILNGGDKSNEELALELGVPEPSLNRAKREFFKNIGKQLSEKKVNSPEILNLLSDAQSLAPLLKGTSWRGLNASEKTLRSKVIRLAHENPELRPHLIPLLK